MAKNLLELAREVLAIEAEGITHLIQKLDQSFVKAVDLLFRARGRAIFAGVGKSGIVARTQRTAPDARHEHARRGFPVRHRSTPS